MAVRIDLFSCFHCGSCEGSCPNSAIKLTPEGPVVNEDLCVECGVCVAECRAGAINF